MNEIDEKYQTKISTIVRTIVLLLALANQILTTCGKNPIPYSEENLYQILSLTVTVVMSLRAWWKNNSFTQAAKLGDMIMDGIKQNKIMLITKEPEAGNGQSQEDKDN